MNVNQEKLDQEIARQLEILEKLSPSDGAKYELAVDSLAKLYKLRIEEEKNESEEATEQDKVSIELDKLKNEQDKVALEMDRFKNELDEKDAEAKDRKFDRWLHFGLDAAGIVVPIIFYNIWMNRGFRFEKDGTFTSTTFKNLFHLFKPTKKQ